MTTTIEAKTKKELRLAEFMLDMLQELNNQQALHRSEFDSLRVPMRSFRGAEPMLEECFDTTGKLHGFDRRIPMNIHPREMLPWKSTIIANQHDEDGNALTKDDGGFQLHNVHSVSLRSVRGQGRIRSPWCCRWNHASYKDGQWLTETSFRTYAGGKWEAMSSGRSRTKGHGDHFETYIAEVCPEFGDVSDLVRICIGLAFIRRYEWRVEIGYPEGEMTINLATDPTGVRRMFRGRSKNPGKVKRDALQGWVNDHWRTNCRQPDDEVYVRKHLRGSTSFFWNGLKVQVFPSEYDTEQYYQFIEERYQLKLRGEDHREAGQPRECPTPISEAIEDQKRQEEVARHPDVEFLAHPLPGDRTERLSRWSRVIQWIKKWIA